MIKRVICFHFCALVALSINQIEGKLKTPEFSPKNYASSGNQAASSYSTIPVDSVNKHIDSPDIASDFTASGNTDQGRTNGVSYSPYQSVESSNTVPSYASYQHQPSIQSPYFYGTPHNPHYYTQLGKNDGSLISRQTFGFGDGDLGTGGGDDGGGGGDLGGLAGLVGLLGLKGLKGLKTILAPFLPILFFPLLLPLLPILLLVALLPLILLLFIPIPVIVSPVTPGRALQEDSLADGVSLRLLHISKALPKLATDVLSSEECVERISCEISRMSKTYKMANILNKMTNHLPKEGVISQKIAKGMAQDDYSSIVKPTRGSKKVTNEDTEGCEIFTCKPKPLIAKHLLSTD